AARRCERWPGPQTIRFCYPGGTVNPFYTGKRLTFTTLSDHTYNKVGYTDVDLDDLEALGLGDVVKLSADELEKLDKAHALQEEHGIADLVLGLDHMATRILSGDREDA